MADVSEELKWDLKENKLPMILQCCVWGSAVLLILRKLTLLYILLS